MSVSVASPPLIPSGPGSTVVGPRKRTMSFSTPSPQPRKAARTPLRRTGSYLSLADMDSGSKEKLYGRQGAPSGYGEQHRIPYMQSLRHYKDQRDQRRNVLSRTSSSVATSSSPSSSYIFMASRKGIPRPRFSSPLSPLRRVLPARATFPRSKPEPDLRRVAIKTRMHSSPEGQKMLHMGPRMAFTMYMATLELEKLVAAQSEADQEVTSPTSDLSLRNSWVVVPSEDWEMLDETS